MRRGFRSCGAPRFQKSQTLSYQELNRTDVSLRASRNYYVKVSGIKKKRIFLI
jgi:hypothetical protein